MAGRMRLPEMFQPWRKAWMRRRYASDLSRFLATNERIAMPTAPEPRVSIVVVLFNAAELSFRLFRSLAAALDVPTEIIVIDNSSTDRTADLLARIDGLRVERNASNLHFLRAANQGAALATGEFLLFVNSDAEVAPGAVGHAVRALSENASAGAVGGRIVLADGRLQEAGSIVWRDGACLGIGRGDDPDDAPFQFRREVDYCSGAFLLVRAALFRDLGGFDETFVPAYYEESDLCMRLRLAGHATLYEPRIRVEHFEFGSSKSGEGVELQRRNRARFVEVHRSVLETSHLPSKAGELAARMRDRRPRVLIVDDRVPYPSLGMGYPRAKDLVRSVHDSGWFVSFFPMWHREIDWDAAYALLPRDIEILSGRGAEQLSQTLRGRQGYYDLVLVSRPHNMRRFLAELAKVPDFLKDTPLVYDAEAIAADREKLRYTVQDVPAKKRRETMDVSEELALTREASMIVAVTDADAERFRKATGKPTAVIGHAVEPTPTSTSFHERRDLLFVGALDDDDSPNVDSLVWFVSEVMPRLDRLVGTDYVLRAAGRNASAAARKLASNRVVFLGKVEDLTSVYAGSRVFIAPTRFAAGIPMKVHSAAAHGVPVVLTRLLLGQLGWTHGREVLAADDPQAFAQACASAYTDARVWAELRHQALQRIELDCDARSFRDTVKAVLDTAFPPEQRRP